MKFCVEVDLILAVHDGMKKNTDNIINDAAMYAYVETDFVQ